MANLKRLTREFVFVEKMNIIHSITSINDNIRYWLVVIPGPQNTPYEGGFFSIKLEFSDQYPYSPPTVEFQTKIFHPNINNKGNICVNIVSPGGWAASLSVKNIIEEIIDLLRVPSPDNPLVPEIAKVYYQNKGKYNDLAKKWTKDFAVLEVIQ